MPSKTCFVTIGATASFSALIDAVLSPSVLIALDKLSYTRLIVQYGINGQENFQRRVHDVQANSTSPTKIEIEGFDIDPSGLSTWLRQAKGSKDEDAIEGVVISHAGSGTILDALRVAAPLIVVPNTQLLDNHQVELAEALAEQGYVVHGDLSNLARALDDAEKLKSRAKIWPPVNSGVHRRGAATSSSATNGEGVVGTRGLKGVLDEEMGFLD